LALLKSTVEDLVCVLIIPFFGLGFGLWAELSYEFLYVIREKTHCLKIGGICCAVSHASGFGLSFPLPVFDC